VRSNTLAKSLIPSKHSNVFVGEVIPLRMVKIQGIHRQSATKRQEASLLCREAQRLNGSGEERKLSFLRYSLDPHESVLSLKQGKD
jgi:hypothetical protein